MGLTQGYAYQVGADSPADAWCLVHGYTFAGSCSDGMQSTMAKCQAMGTCSDPNTVCGSNCLGVQQACENVAGGRVPRG